MVRTSLPPGFRFHPTDVELVMYYLKRKVMGKKIPFEAISELNIYKFSPWDLPDKSCLKSKDLEWYFFCPRERKYASGSRMNRSTETGYWKTTGKDRPVTYNKNSVGMVKTLVFHQGCAPRGQRTDWVIHEYRIEDKNLADMGYAQDAYVLCKLFHKSGPGPKNGASYGAPFREEDWDDDEEIPVDSLLPGGPSTVEPVQPENDNSSAAISLVDLGNAPLMPPNEPGPSFVQPSKDTVLSNGQNSSMVTRVVDTGNASGWSLSEAGLTSASHSGNGMDMDPPDDILHLLAAFSEDSPLLPTVNGNTELGDLGQGRAAEAIPHSDGGDLFSGLEDLSNLAELNGGGLNLFDNYQIGYTTNNMRLQDDSGFLELNDLDAPLNFTAQSCGPEQMHTGGLYRPSNSSGSEHVFAGSLCTEYNTSNHTWNGDNIPGYEQHPTDLHHLLVLPDASDIQGNSTSIFPMGNVYDSTNAAYNLDFTTNRPLEDIRNAAGNQERGAQQRTPHYSRLQQLLESVPADPASAAYDGSSIHVKAEVTYRFATCTKDALSVMVGESTFVFSPWWNLPVLGFQKAVGYRGCGSPVVFCLRLDSAFVCMLMFSLLREFVWYLWSWFCFCEIIGCFKTIHQFVLTHQRAHVVSIKSMDFINFVSVLCS
ncbi:NAC domain-containing protein 82-like [Coffea arabica]|uniref:NAC domain-containing protein 82-like n=1 Tax=Coffea arabica TaxID=13443 RepID=A0A6P6TLK7_COFAR|nr:NAC domain-containing protein 82-like [Coffea arabica]